MTEFSTRLAGDERSRCTAILSISTFGSEPLKIRTEYLDVSASRHRSIVRAAVFPRGVFAARTCVSRGQIVRHTHVRRIARSRNLRRAITKLTCKRLWPMLYARKRTRELSENDRCRISRELLPSRDTRSLAVRTLAPERGPTTISAV